MSPATPTPPTGRPPLNSGTPPGSPLMFSDCGVGLMTSDPGSDENCTPYSGPPGVFCTGWGKWSWMMKRAVRVVNASWELSKKAAVLARAAAAPMASPTAPARAKMPSTTPSRSTTTTACVGAACDAACARIVDTSAEVRWVVSAGTIVLKSRRGSRGSTRGM